MVHESSNGRWICFAWICQVTQISKIASLLTARFEWPPVKHDIMDENLTMTSICESTWVESARNWIYKHQGGSPKLCIFILLPRNIQLPFSQPKNIYHKIRLPRYQERFLPNRNHKPPQLSSMYIPNQTLRDIRVKCTRLTYWTFYQSSTMSDKGRRKAVEKPDISDEEYERECLL